MLFIHTHTHTHKPWSPDDYAWSVSNTNYCNGCFEKEYIVYSGFFRPLVVFLQSTVIYPIHPDLRNIIFLGFFFGDTSNTDCISILILRNKKKKRNQSTRREKNNTSGVLLREKRSNQMLFAEMFKAYNKTCTITAHTPPGKHKLIRPDRESIPRYRAIKTQSSVQNLKY